MKYATVEDVFVSFPHPVLSTVQGEPDYQKNQLHPEVPSSKLEGN
jgi:hypothetical protein